MFIREATEADNEALCRMELLAPQGTTISLAERRRDFAYRAHLFPGSILLVADSGQGPLIGVMGGAPVRMRVGGEERLAGYLYDLRANPEYKRGLSRVIYMLWREMERRLLAHGIEFVCGLVKRDNPAASIYYRMGGRKVGTRTFWSLPVYRRKRVDPGVTVANQVDAVADYQAAAAWYKNHEFWPILPDPSVMTTAFARQLRAELHYQEASAKIWDGTVDYERIVMHAPAIFEIARPLAAAARLVFPVPRIPRVGEPLRTWNIFDLRLPSGLGPMRPLLAMANNLALEAGIDFLVVSASGGEPELAAAGRGALATLHYDLLVKEYKPLPEISPRTYLDIRAV